jgi:phosphopantothenoylcysteine decarboxylase/phosphopantothenate--cysteine ligase
MFEGKNIILGVTGSVAAYKAVYLARLLMERGASVWPVLTPAATRFVGPMSFSALTGHRAVVDLWESAKMGSVGHVDMATHADVCVVAPASADTLARVAQGRADDPLAAVLLSTAAPCVWAPAMETHMWENTATQQHVQVLHNKGMRFVMPETGLLASGLTGVGRMAEVEDIVWHVYAALCEQDLKGKKVWVTAGTTREWIDPVRFVANPSTGKMGYALAQAAWCRGAEVHLVSGPTHLAKPTGVHRHVVETTQDMLDVCEKQVGFADVLLMAAAPVDFRVQDVSTRKLKKKQGMGQGMLWVETPDILMRMAQLYPHVCKVGFAAETHDVAAYAHEKLHAKNLDMVVANDVSDPSIGFASDNNAVTLFRKDGVQSMVPTQSKQQVAHVVLDHVLHILRGHHQTL